MYATVASVNVDTRDLEPFASPGCAFHFGEYGYVADKITSHTAHIIADVMEAKAVCY